jgi:hypothetical protein
MGGGNGADARNGGNPGATSRSGGSSAQGGSATLGNGGAGGGNNATGGAAPPEGGPPPAPNGGPPTIDPNCTPSRLFGKTGELWKPDGRLIDPSYAGYHTGLDPLPRVDGPIKRVTDFGAKGDDMADDTAAFTTAIAETQGVLLVPAGRYVITKRLDIRKSNFVLRGEGIDKTTLLFPRPLSETNPGDANYPFNGGFLWLTGTDPGAAIGNITSNAARGARELQVSATTGVEVGQWVRVVQTDRGGSLFRALHGGANQGNASEDGGDEVFHFYSKVQAVTATTVSLERTLPFEVDTNWTPQLKKAAPTVREVGIEDLTLEMDSGRYPGHFNERGFNGIYFDGAHDSWVRDVRILNADFGLSLYRSYFCTAKGVIIDANIDRGGTTGHHALNAARGADNWFTEFDVRKRYLHDLTVDGYVMGTVWSKGKGVDMNMDHHGRAPYGNLWTNLDMGQGTRIYNNGGAANRLPPSGAYNTFWNLKASRSVGLPGGGYGPFLNFVGPFSAGGGSNWSVENIAANTLCQPDLHEFMLAQRKAKQP